MGCATAHLRPRPGEGSKGQISFNFSQGQFQRFVIPVFMLVLTNKRYETYIKGISFCRLGHALGAGLGGA